MVLKDSGSCFLGFETDHFEKNGPLQVDKLSDFQRNMVFPSVPPNFRVYSHQIPTPDPNDEQEEQEDVAVPCVEKPRPSPSGNSVTWQFCPVGDLLLRTDVFRNEKHCFLEKHVFGKCFCLSVLGRLIIYPLGILCAMKLSLCSLHRVQRYQQAEDSLTS